jgi:enhancing lycopene biosynthesis protein 2
MSNSMITMSIPWYLYVQSNDYDVQSMIFVCSIQWLPCPFHDICMSNQMITMSNPWYLFAQSNDYHVQSAKSRSGVM